MSNEIRNTQYLHSVLHFALMVNFSYDLPRRPSPNLHGVVRAPVPRIHLAHRGEEQAGDGGLDGGDVLGMVHERDRLGILGAVQPDFVDPTSLEFGVEALDGGDGKFGEY